jgi:hypothetical protein
MAHLPVLPPEARRVLELARSDRRAAREALGALSAEAQTALLLDTPVSSRAALLDLIDQPEQVVPGLPPADLCLLARSIGLEEAGWLLTCATNEQLVASIDLDAWDGALPDRHRFGEWVAALADAGEETLLRATSALDFEMLVLHVRERSVVVLKSNEDDWEPPAGGQTVDGVFYFIPRAETDDLAELMELIQALFSNDYWMYFRLAQGGIWELDMETEEWALRWRRGRLEDLGFPNFDDAMRIYSFLREDRRSQIPTRKTPSTLESDAILPVSVPPLPIVSDAAHALFRAMAALAETERGPIRAAFLELANRVAMADRLPLGEPETLEKALEKAARVGSRGLEYLAAEHSIDGAEVLRRVTVERLFQVGHNLAPEPRKTRPEKPEAVSEAESTVD